MDPASSHFLAPSSSPLQGVQFYRKKEKFSQNLTLFSRSNIFTNYLILGENGKLITVNIFQFLREKVRAFLGCEDRIDKQLVASKMLRYLWKNRRFSETNSDVERVRAIAKRIGLEPTHERYRKNIELLKEICQTTFNQSGEESELLESFFQEFDIQHQRDLDPHVKKIKLSESGGVQDGADQPVNLEVKKNETVAERSDYIARRFLGSDWKKTATIVAAVALSLISATLYYRGNLTPEVLIREAPLGEGPIPQEGSVKDIAASLKTFTWDVGKSFEVVSETPHIFGMPRDNISQMGIVEPIFFSPDFKLSNGSCQKMESDGGLPFMGSLASLAAIFASAAIGIKKLYDCKKQKGIQLEGDEVPKIEFKEENKQENVEQPNVETSIQVDANGVKRQFQELDKETRPIPPEYSQEGSSPEEGSGHSFDVVDRISERIGACVELEGSDIKITSKWLDRIKRGYWEGRISFKDGEGKEKTVYGSHCFKLRRVNSFLRENPFSLVQKFICHYSLSPLDDVDGIKNWISKEVSIHLTDLEWDELVKEFLTYRKEFFESVENLIDKAFHPKSMKIEEIGVEILHDLGLSVLDNEKREGVKSKYCQKNLERDWKGLEEVEQRKKLDQHFFWGSQLAEAVLKNSQSTKNQAILNEVKDLFKVKNPQVEDVLVEDVQRAYVEKVYYLALKTQKFLENASQKVLKKPFKRRNVEAFLIPREQVSPKKTTKPTPLYRLIEPEEAILIRDASLDSAAAVVRMQSINKKGSYNRVYGIWTNICEDVVSRELKEKFFREHGEEEWHRENKVYRKLGPLLGRLGVKHYATFVVDKLNDSIDQSTSSTDESSDIEDSRDGSDDLTDESSDIEDSRDRSEEITPVKRSFLLERCDGSLEDFKPGEMSNRQLEQFGQDICRALKIMHQNGYIHGDLKQDNIFYVWKEEGLARAKIADFGKSLKFHLVNQLIWEDEALGAPIYRAPESFFKSDRNLGKIRESALDMWSLGLTFYAMRSDEIPILELEKFVTTSEKDSPYDLLIADACDRIMDVRYWNNISRLENLEGEEKLNKAKAYFKELLGVYPKIDKHVTLWVEKGLLGIILNAHHTSDKREELWDAFREQVIIPKYQEICDLIKKEIEEDPYPTPLDQAIIGLLNTNIEERWTLDQVIASFKDPQITIDDHLMPTFSEEDSSDHILKENSSSDIEISISSES